MDWRHGWTSAWPEPERWPEPLLEREDERRIVRRIVEGNRAQGTSTSVTSFRLMSLPDELLAGLTIMILMVDTKGLRWAGVSQLSKQLFVCAHAQLTRDGVAWWTGCGEPHHPPPLPPVNEVIDATLNFSKFLRGMEYKDVARINTSDGWLNTFSIDAILAAMGCSVLSPRDPYVAQPIEGSLVLSAQLGGLATLRLMTEYPQGFPTTSFWGRADVRQAIDFASCFIIPLNVGHNHWVAARVVKAHSVVEIFNSMAAQCRDLELTRLLQLLESCGVVGARAYRIIHHNSHPAWRQTDGAACGIFCSLIILSLVRGARVCVFQRDVALWRSHLCHVVLEAVGASLLT